MSKPLFKWTGGKNRMRDKYACDFWPKRNFKVFIDAFYGGGSVSHWVAEKYPDVLFIINDDNSELMNMYRTLQYLPNNFCDKVAELERDFLLISADDKEARKAFYNSIKMTYIDDHQQPIDEHASLYFMLKINFNGWWKTYNYSKGRYATPPGVVQQKGPFIDYDMLQQRAEFFRERCLYILDGDFATTLQYVDRDSYLYFDPPYRDSTTEYTEQGFDDADQISMCEVMKEAAAHNAQVSMSNKEIGDGFWHKHLPEFEILEYDVKYTAGRGTTTNEVKEVLIRNFESEIEVPPPPLVEIKNPLQRAMQL